MDVPTWLFLPLECSSISESLPDSPSVRALHALADLRSFTCSLDWIGRLGTTIKCTTFFDFAQEKACDYHLRPVVVLLTVLSFLFALTLLSWSSLSHCLRSVTHLTMQLGFLHRVPPIYRYLLPLSATR